MPERSDYFKQTLGRVHTRRSSLMALGFTESKEDSNLYLNVEGGRPVMLLLYVDDLFLTKKRNSLNLQERDEGVGRDPKEVQDDGLHGHNHTHVIELEATECFFIRVG